MKAVILCAGYATRLYPFTINEPKALLPVDGRPLLSYTIKNISDISGIDKIYVITNDKFNNHFLEWKKKEDSRIEIVNDGTKTNEDRIGGVMDFALALDKCGEEDILLILGDNYFNFKLKEFIDFFKQKNTTCIALRDTGDKEKAKRFGVVEINDKNKLIGLEEKPENPKSTLISTGCYAFTKKDLPELKEFIKSDKNKEGPAYIIKDFVERGMEVNGFIFKADWHDIGTIEDYEIIKREVKELEDEQPE